jgi:hypothetical protein
MSDEISATDNRKSLTFQKAVSRDRSSSGERRLGNGFVEGHEKGTAVITPRVSKLGQLSRTLISDKISKPISIGTITRQNGTKGKNHAGVSMSVQVIVRKRPVPSDQLDVLEVVSPIVTVQEQKVKVDMTKYIYAHSYAFDQSFGEGCSSKELYDKSVHDLIGNVFEGGTSTTFCFGQTASGKTFTLFGAGGGQGMHESLNWTGGEAEAARGGIYLLAAFEIYERVKALAESDLGIEMSVSLSMYEIKGQKLFDLFNHGAELHALEDGNGVLQLVGLTQCPCATFRDFLEASNVGRSARSTAATGANATSSRSHCAMVVRVYKRETLLGKLSLIDLAGSERGADNEDTDAATRKEGRDINTSLLALKEVIRALQSGHHAPFRQSKLTQVLEESLKGQQCRTVVIACVSGAEHDTQHTVNTLRYAQDLRPKQKTNIDLEIALNVKMIANKKKEQEKKEISLDSKKTIFSSPQGAIRSKSRVRSMSEDAIDFNSTKVPSDNGN